MSTEEQQAQFEEVFEKHLMNDYEREVQVILLIKFISRKCDLEQFTEFCKAEAIDHTEDWIAAINESIRELGDAPDISRIPEPEDDFTPVNYLYEFASAIVEPTGVDGEATGYNDFQQSDAWAPFIRENFGEVWGKIADYVFVNGY